MREGCLRAEGCLATAWLPIIGRALEVLCLRVRAWTCLDGVRRAALLRYAGQRPSKFPYPTSDKNANLTKLVYVRLESYCGPR